jgi:hypothetical protein
VPIHREASGIKQLSSHCGATIYGSAWRSIGRYGADDPRRRNFSNSAAAPATTIVDDEDVPLRVDHQTPRIQFHFRGRTTISG